MENSKSEWKEHLPIEWEKQIDYYTLSLVFNYNKSKTTGLLLILTEPS